MNINVTFSDNTTHQYSKGTTIYEISKDIASKYKYDILIAKVNNQIMELNEKINTNCTIDFYDLTSKFGNKVYENGLIYLLIYAVNKVLNTDIIIRHTIDRGVYCEFNDQNILRNLDDDIIIKLKDEMMLMVSEQLPINKVTALRIDSIKYLSEQKLYDKAKLLKYTINPYIEMYQLKDMFNYFVGELPINTSILKYFDLTFIKDRGVVLRFPSIYNPDIILPYTHHEKFFDTIYDYHAWAQIFEISNIGDLNEKISLGNIGDLIRTSETFYNNHLMDIAKYIEQNKNMKKIILISGPSSSGKTTTAKKLALYLRSLGLKPHTISIDDYFLDRTDTPMDENGKPNFETIGAVDIDLFNNQLNSLLNGDEVLLPEYNFIKGEKEYKHKILKMGNDDILVIEGLHALNEKLTQTISRNIKYKIYLSPLTFLNIDRHNRINMTDIRLLRRLVRDYKYRGYSASKTLDTWHSVRRGEEEYVFPYQDEADIILNTFLMYELGVIKTYAEPLLYSVNEDDENYPEAYRLIKFLSVIESIPSDEVPPDSILREFIGNSCFYK